MSKEFRLKIITPQLVKYDEDTEMIIMRCLSGDMGVLADHTDCMAILDIGIARIIKDGETKEIGIFGGIVKIKDNKVTVLANAADWPEDVNLEEVESERSKAEELLKTDLNSAERHNEILKLRRASVQVEIASLAQVVTEGSNE